jgi:hypothetical protein
MECSKGEMAEMLLFVFIQNHQEIFEPVAALLKQPSSADSTTPPQQQQNLLYWCGQVLSPKKQKVRTVRV